MKNKLFFYKFLYLLFILVVVAFINSCGGGPGEIVTYGGKVLLQDGTPLEGIEVTFFWPNPPNIDSNGILSAVTDEDGWYSLELSTFSPPSYFSVTPSHPEYNFSPTSYSFGKIEADNLDLNFVAIPLP